MQSLLHFDLCVYFKLCHCFRVLAILKFLLIKALVLCVPKCVVSMGSWCSRPVMGPRFPLLVTVLPLVLGCSCCPPDWHQGLRHLLVSCESSSGSSHQSMDFAVLLTDPCLCISKLFWGCPLILSGYFTSSFVTYLSLLWAPVWGDDIRSS